MIKTLRNLAAKAAFGLWIVLNRYEGAQRGSTDRSWLPAWVQDARFDATAATRYELVRKSRYFERNSAIFNRLCDLFEQYTVGPQGLQFVPASMDDAWNETAKAWWDEWCTLADLVSRQPFGTLQGIVARCWAVDGEVFILKTRGDASKGQPAFPRIQLIESHRVKTPGSMVAQEGKTIIDGVEIDPRGRPIAYWVRDGLDYADETFSRKPADQVIHVFEPGRPGQMRGLPPLYPVMNDLHDLDDLQVLEMQAAKQAAEITNVVVNPAGEMKASELRQQRFQAQNQTSAGVDVTETRTQNLKQVLGARTIALRTGEDLKQFLSNRPTVAQKAYWDYVAGKVCIGFGIPKILVFPESIQGTVARAEFDIAHTFFRSRSSILAAAFTQIYWYVMGWAKDNVQTLADPPANWRQVSVRPPRAVNVDVGRNSAAMIAELEAGTRTFEDIFAELGYDWRQRLRQKAVEMAYITALATEFKLDTQQISSSAVIDATQEAGKEAASTGATS